MSKTSNINRVDGFAKVTGSATYSAEYKTAGVVYACLVGSTIAKGRIKTIDTKKAEWAPGVLAVITHLNVDKPVGYEKVKDKHNFGQPLQIFKDDSVLYYDQPIALVIADTFERMQYAASLIKADYFKEEHSTELKKAADKEKKVETDKGNDYHRGEHDGYKNAEVILEAEYTIPTEVHNPMELANIIAKWDGNKPVLYTKSQGVEGTRKSVAGVFGVSIEDVEVHSEYLGGAFGMGLHTWPYEIAALIGSKKLNRPVKLVLHREQMFTNVGFRPYTIQKMGLGATKAGKLTGLTHEAVAMTSSYEDFMEGTVNMSRFIYDCANVSTRYRIVPLDTCTPIWMRGPGEATGSFALECAMDELAHKLNMDPIEFRKLNYAEKDLEQNKPWSSKYLLECYEGGMERIGWKNRKNEPGSVKEGNWLVGYGMGTGTFGCYRSPTSVKAKFLPDGNLVLQCSVNDMGPGTATMMTAIGAEITGLPAENVIIEMGKSGLPKGPTQGGSATTSSVGSAVHDSCNLLVSKVLELAAQNPTFKGIAITDLTFENGLISSKKDKTKTLALTSLLTVNKLEGLEVENLSKGAEEAKKYSIYSFSVHFVKVLVNLNLGKIRLAHVVSCADIGTVINQKTSAGQMFGGAVGGIGMGLMEALEIDHRFGRPINNNFADYHVPVNADIEKQEVFFVNKKDPISNPMGTKGLGETALVGMAPAIANAVFNATGKRVRDLPIRLDKIIETVV
ncbi:xanthine dehydrogenase family protein molybdopterin-binding subunit [Flavobacterium johnsoniae]|uniref:Xanthine dehydrogenase, molybdenum binding subunit apoprotein n=1 Tax=Flavobacterium johnsoniae (strain ATCC 17061 / DSM 2064 / JCM 8514 / BCRC 14874 / CCUG 350202 / NBRC 14942 / NCIMB 11054 / UW101) TaxID=376686 RepID=A5FC64_FLAJ1|nr:xanthine dehydrogenase family protein molybdopterin-binding subunit [Flavobacterium johnsoniae]ABQ07208.1 xanthine dehydrogenase, molybdenum binding subunit apoprotein [Flavobacterium johnsoniae UW101]OXE95832.1 aldehyde oxidase [Flavobacterium johnsoniae UW101]WQG80954.1 xanthine dehydrogenase family protein molybdopterin-binding subunit [Flavobacterium johnsoniae UW101]SHL27114.1 xanthine dehydrogenase YagR molybdenum-binding subunit [Flavobacterium johnsoniae]